MLSLPDEQEQNGGSTRRSIGWPLSLAVGLVVANAMGLLLREWSAAPAAAVARMRYGLAVLIIAILLRAESTKMNA
jgi:L-rhamnose-H+ transport protein